jgi:hypothetical protein
MSGLYFIIRIREMSVEIVSVATLFKARKEVHRMKSGVENDLYIELLKFRISVKRSGGGERNTLTTTHTMANS